MSFLSLEIGVSVIHLHQVSIKLLSIKFKVLIIYLLRLSKTYNLNIKWHLQNIDKVTWFK